MAIGDPMTDSRSVTDSWWSDLGDAVKGVFTDVAAGVGTISRQVLPVWAASELGLARQDQLADPTRSYAAANAQQTPILTTAGTVGGVSQVSTMEWALLGVVALIGVVLIARG